MLRRSSPGAVAAARNLRRCSALWYRRRLGGYTGDTLGATQQITEARVLSRDAGRMEFVADSPHPLRCRWPAPAMGSSTCRSHRHRAADIELTLARVPPVDAGVLEPITTVSLPRAGAREPRPVRRYACCADLRELNFGDWEGRPLGATCRAAAERRVGRRPLESSAPPRRIRTRAAGVACCARRTQLQSAERVARQRR